MKTIEQIEAQIAELQKQVEALKAQPKEWPQVGDLCFCIGSNGTVLKREFGNDYAYKGIFSQGNAFRTQAEAEAERDARAVVAELRKQPGRKKFVVREDNWCVVVQLTTSDVFCLKCSDIDFGWHSIYFDSEESVQAAINAVGADRILKAARWFAMQEC